MSKNNPKLSDDERNKIIEVLNSYGVSAHYNSNALHQWTLEGGISGRQPNNPDYIYPDCHVRIDNRGDCCTNQFALYIRGYDINVGFDHLPNLLNKINKIINCLDEIRNINREAVLEEY